MAILSAPADITAATVAAPTTAILKVVYSPTDDQVSVKANVEGVDGDEVAFSANGAVAIPGVGTLTAATLDVTDYAGLKTALVNGYGRYMEETVVLTVSSV